VTRALLHPRRPPSVSLGRFLSRSLKEQWRDYRKEFKRCQERFGEDSVHQLRIAIRRMLSTLSLLATVLPGENVTVAQRALKKRLKTFARLRDTHVQLLDVQKRRRDFPAAKTFRDALARRERRLIKRVRRRMSDAQHGALAGSIRAIQEQLRELAGDPEQERTKVASVLSVAREAYAGVIRRYCAIQPAQATTIHRTRVAFKKFRYMIESLQPLLPRVTQRQLRSMRDYQTRMGDIQDVEVLLTDLDKFILKHQFAGGEWELLRAELQRRRLTLVNRFMASRHELLEFRPPKDFRAGD